MAYNTIIPSGGGGGGDGLLTKDNIWTGTNSYVNSVSFTSAITSTNIATADDDIPNLKTVKDVASGGLMPKTPVRVVGLVNLTLAGLYNVTNSNGTPILLVDGDNVCASAQTNNLENARYIARLGGWELATDCLVGSDQRNTIFSETSTGDKYQQTSDPAIVGTNPLVFTLYSHSALYVGDGTTIEIALPNNVISVKDLGIDDAKVATTAGIQLSKLADITGFVSSAGVVADTDTIVQAIGKLDGNTAIKAPLLNPTFDGMIGITGPNSQVAFGSGPYFSFLNSSGLTVNRIVNFPDADTVTLQPATFVANQFVTHIDTSGVQQTAQPTINDLSGILPTTKGGTGFDIFPIGGLLIGDITNSLEVVTPNITTNSKVLTQIGTGTEAGTTTWTTQSDRGEEVTGTVDQVLVNGVGGIPQSGSLVLTTPQDIATSSSPTFNIPLVSSLAVGNLIAGAAPLSPLHVKTGVLSPLGEYGLSTISSDGGLGLTFGLDGTNNTAWINSRAVAPETVGNIPLNINDLVILTDSVFSVGTKAGQHKVHVAGAITTQSYANGFLAIDTADPLTGLGGYGFSFGVDDYPYIVSESNPSTFPDFKVMGLNKCLFPKLLNIPVDGLDGLVSINTTNTKTIDNLNTFISALSVNGFAGAYGTSSIAEFDAESNVVSGLSGKGLAIGYDPASGSEVWIQPRDVGDGISLPLPLKLNIAGQLWVDKFPGFVGIHITEPQSDLHVKGFDGPLGDFGIATFEIDTIPSTGLGGIGITMGYNSVFQESWINSRAQGISTTTLNINNRLYIDADNVGVGSLSTTGGGSNTFFIQNSVAPPLGSPTEGVMLYCFNNDMFAKNPSGQIKKIST